MAYKTLRYELSGEIHSWDCGPDSIQFEMTREEVVKFFLREFQDHETFFILGWDS